MATRLTSAQGNTKFREARRAGDVGNRPWLLLLATIATSSASIALGHPISLSSAIVEVHEDHIIADLQIMLEDLVLYQQLAADGEHRYAADELRGAADKHSEFVQKYFTIRGSDGQLLAVTLQELDTSRIEEGGVHQTELMKKTVRYVLSFSVPQRQSFLTFVQTFGGPDATLPAIMDLMVLHNGVMLERPTQLSRGRPHTWKLDWDNPPTGEANTLPKLREKRDQQLREQLGIATYGGLYSFLYITRFDVRHEVLTPLLTFEQWLPISRQNPDFLEVAEQQAAHEMIKQFFQERSPVAINGVPVVPQLTRLNFFGLDINDFALNAEPRRVSVYQARVGIILSYPSQETPEEIVMQWENFTGHAPYLRTIVLVGNDDPDNYIFRVGRTQFKWQGELIRAQVEAVAAESSSLDVTTAKEVLKRLLSNIYRAFDFREDSHVYDALATSVKGDLLRGLYLQVKRSLLVAEQGGALSHVTDLEILEVKSAVKSDSSSYEVTWQVTGTVEHWGHIHTRVSEYGATFSLALVDGAWKLDDVSILSEKRIKFETRIRGYNPD